MLKISSEGRAAALDLRLLTRKAHTAQELAAIEDGDDLFADAGTALEEAQADSGHKIGAAATWLHRNWEENKDNVYIVEGRRSASASGRVVHLVFC